MDRMAPLIDRIFRTVRIVATRLRGESLAAGQGQLDGLTAAAREILDETMDEG